MAIAPLSLRPDYWETFEIQDQDLDFLYNHLLDIETPLTTHELINELIRERIQYEKEALKNRRPEGGRVYMPKERYEVGDLLVFPVFGGKKGKVVSIRPGNNPEIGQFNVIEVSFENKHSRLFAEGIESHVLNEPLKVDLDDPLLNDVQVMERYGESFASRLEQVLSNNPDLVRIAGRWFPRALLVDVNAGHLNLAEAVLDMAGGGPLQTSALLEQIELPTDVNRKLTEFSLNLALQEDNRFDEVGPAGEVLWFLQRLEPEPVRQPPTVLRHHNTDYEHKVLSQEMLAIERELDDELSPIELDGANLSEVTIHLIYPHWRAGTLPLSPRVQRMFPTAYEAPRIQFSLLLGEEENQVSGWVIREHRYVYGLNDWYVAQGLIPGTRIHIKKGKKPGEVKVWAEKHRPTREWIRTVLVGADGGVVYAVLKQLLNANIDERMAIAVPDREGMDKAWDQVHRQRLSLDQVVIATMRELSKLNMQGHVHAQELYACVNIIRRSPPGPIFSLLASRPVYKHVGDLYFRLDDSNLSEENE